MPTRYLILRSNVDLDKSFDPANPSSWRPGQGAPSELEVVIKDGRESDFPELCADPKNVAVDDAGTQLSLITPVASAESGTATLEKVGMLRMPEGLLAVKAHTCPFSGKGVTVAVLDTGIREDHPAFRDRIIAKRDFTGEGATADDVTDRIGHGTHCAGTICGGVVDDVRVGVAPDAKLCVGKVFGADGCSLELLVKGLLWAVVEEGASVVSMSLGYNLYRNARQLIEKFGYEEPLAYQKALRQYSDFIRTVTTLRNYLETQSNNVVFVAAAGNESQRPRLFLDADQPAAELLPVGAVRMTGSAAGKWEVADFSNGRVQIVAPGFGVVSAAASGGWATMSGTSMATPHVAGVAALWIEKLRDAGKLGFAGIVRSALMLNATTEPLVDSNPYNVGIGMVQAPA